MESIRPFHLAFPVTDIPKTRKWYQDILGCTIGRECERWIGGHPILNAGGNMIALPGVWNGRPTRTPMSRYPSEIIIKDLGNNDAVFSGRGIEPAWRAAEEIVRILRGAQVQDIAPDIMSSSTA